MTLSALDCIHTFPKYDPFRGADDWEFIPEAAEAKIDWIEGNIVHTEGRLAGKPYILEPHQRGMQYMLWGWFHKKLKVCDRNGRWRGIRRIREGLYYCSRKGSKSTDCAVVMNTIIFTEPDWRMQLYGCASAARQSGKVFNIMEAQIKANPEMMKRVKIYASKSQQSIRRLMDDTLYIPLPDNAEVEHGANVKACLCDEIHTYESAALPIVMRTGMIAHDEGLLLSATTADWDRESFCNRTLDYAKKVRDGVIDDPRFLPMIWEPDKEKLKNNPDYWQTEECWREANPMYGIVISKEVMQSECSRAIADPIYRLDFKRLLCNIQTVQITQLISPELWARGDGEFPPGHFEGRTPVGAALDLSSSHDTTSLCIAYGDTQNGIDLVWYHWLPVDAATEQEREHNVPFTDWSEGGWIKLTHGDQIDYDEIERDIIDVFEKHGITKFVVDPLFQAKQLCQRLQAEGYEPTYFKCNAINLTAPIDEMMRLLGAGKIRHGNNPILRVQSANAMLEMRGDNLKHLSKRKSTGQIDGVITMAMNMPGLLENKPDTTSQYSKAGQSAKFTTLRIGRR